MHGRDEMVGRAQFAREFDNLRSAVTWSLDASAPGDVESALRIITAIAPEADAHHKIGVGLWALRAAPRAPEGTPGQRAAVLAAAGLFVVQMGEIERGRALAKEALRDGPPLESPWPYLPYTVLGMADHQDGHPERAYEIISDARRQLEGSAIDPFNLTALTVVVAAWAITIGDPSARSEAEAGLALSMQSGNPSNLCVAHAVLGMALMSDDEPRALAELEESIRLVRTGTNDTMYPLTLGLAAIVRARNGASMDAVADLHEALTHCAEHRLRVSMGATLVTGIEVLNDVGDPEAAAVLAGVTQDGAYKSQGATRLPSGNDRDEVLNAITERLGAEAFAGAYERGAQMSEADAIAYALNETKRRLAETEPARSPQ
jgi:hypothetical protein